MIQKDKDITDLTTFRLPAKAKFYAEYSSMKELTAIMKEEVFYSESIFHMGGGSNLLFVKDFDGLVLHSCIKGIVRYDKDDTVAYAIAGAGEKWTDFVDWCLAAGLAGVENLAGIPGEVGASAVQNIGAYGAEAKDVIHHVECFDTLTRDVKVFTNEECRFGYRDSIFKHSPGRYFVLRVSFRLRNSSEATNLTYGPLRELAARLGHHPTIEEVAAEVVKVRNQKLPDPAVLGSAGSFFKNPVVEMAKYEELKALFPEMPHYPTLEGRVKIPAGWLIENAGLKGCRIGDAEVYPRQCLVIVNTGHATAEEVVKLADHVVATVEEKYGIRLSPEVNYIG